MNTTTAFVGLTPGASDGAIPRFHARPASSWGAIIAGALVIAALSLLLLSVGAGLGLSAPPSSPQFGTAAAMSGKSAAWLIVMQWLAAGMGGYIAGRLRGRWLGTHTHEIFFRDTAHGLVAWALATLVVFASGAAPMAQWLSAGTTALSARTHLDADGGADADAARAADRYAVDQLWRPASESGTSGSSERRDESRHIIENALSAGTVPEADKSYLANAVSHATGASAGEAQQRVEHFVSEEMARQSQRQADAVARAGAARKAAWYIALSLLIGAFIASVAAPLGGLRRDEHV